MSRYWKKILKCASKNLPKNNNFINKINQGSKPIWKIPDIIILSISAWSKLWSKWIGTGDHAGFNSPKNRFQDDQYKERDAIIKSLKEENQRLTNQRTLSELSRGPIMNFNFKNETKACYEPNYSLLVINRIARNGNNEETIITKGLSSVGVPLSIWITEELTVNPL